MSTPTLAAVVRALQNRYPPEYAESWDRVGLVCGDPLAKVPLVHFAVDPTATVAREAVAAGAGLLVTHHPLLLRGVHSVAASSGKGRVIHDLIRGGCGLFSMHTNADAAHGGTNSVLVDLLGLTDVVPLQPVATEAMFKLTVFVPPEQREELIAALNQAGAGVGDHYREAAYWSAVEGQFRPTETARPAAGHSGVLHRGPEDRVEVLVPAAARPAVTAALRSVHPYEVPAFDFVAVAGERAAEGIGRVGTLPKPMTLPELTELIAQILPATVTAPRAAGDPATMISRVALCSGAGDSLLPLVRTSDAEVYITADLRHHPVEEHLGAGGCPLIDVSHWASEWPWLPGAAARLEADLAAQGVTVKTYVSTIPTDPWTVQARRIV